MRVVLLIRVDLGDGGCEESYEEIYRGRGECGGEGGRGHLGFRMVIVGV